MVAGGRWSAAELEAQYNNRARRPDTDELMAGWQARSEAFRVAVSGNLDLAYGPGLRDRLDYFPAATPGGPGRSAFLESPRRSHQPRGAAGCGDGSASNASSARTAASTSDPCSSS